MVWKKYQTLQLAIYFSAKNEWLAQKEFILFLFLFFHWAKIKPIYCPMSQNFPVQLPGMCTRDINKHLTMNIFPWKSSGNGSKKSFDNVLILILEKN